MTTFKTESADWKQFCEEEHSLDEYLEKYGSTLKRQSILDTVKSIITKSDLVDMVEASITSL